MTAISMATAATASPFDGSYFAAVAFDNWLIYGGLVDQWWGPGWDGNLILTNNARPFPKIGFMRNNPAPFDIPVLNLLGPWQVNGIVGLLEDNGARAVNNTAFVGLRVSAMPLPGLELGASRTIQLCGSGRSCSFRTIGKAIFGNTNTGNVASDVANQIAGVDASYRNHVGPLAFSLYGSVYGEDEAGNLPSREAVTAGLTLAGPLGDSGIGWRLIGEYANTIAGDVVGKSRNPGVWYNSGAYPSGYRYLNRSMGHTIDGDAEIFSVAAIITDTMDRTWRLKFINLELNKFNNRRGQLSPAGPEKINILEAGVAWPTQWGLFDVDLRYMDNRPNSPGSDKDDFGAELRWSRPVLSASAARRRRPARRVEGGRMVAGIVRLGLVLAVAFALMGALPERAAAQFLPSTTAAGDTPAPELPRKHRARRRPRAARASVGRSGARPPARIHRPARRAGRNRRLHRRNPARRRGDRRGDPRAPARGAGPGAPCRRRLRHHRRPPARRPARPWPAVARDAGAARRHRRRLCCARGLASCDERSAIGDREAQRGRRGL